MQCYVPTRSLRLLRFASMRRFLTFLADKSTGLALLGALAWLSLILGNSPSGRLAAAETAQVNFTRDVKPILARRCFACHGPETSEGGLRLDDPASATAELDSGMRAVVAGQPDESELIVRVTSTDEAMRMPLDGEPLSAEEVETLRKWIAAGGKWEKHWAFVPPTRDESPAVRNAAWVRNPIDAFILKKLDAAGLTPATPADKRTLARRAYYNLIGLPPTNGQLERYLNDDNADAWQRLIDELLATSHYGEHWARHWLDIVRYAETNSFERDGPKPNAWKYRDYVIRSLNSDKPYDQFLREQLAGDELDEVTPDTIIATGYYRLAGRPRPGAIR
jgi:mono/diheme cytochrome c family protein